MLRRDDHRHEKLGGSRKRSVRCGRRDLNPHARRHCVLSAACLPFHHFREINSLRVAIRPVAATPAGNRSASDCGNLGTGI